MLNNAVYLYIIDLHLGFQFTDLHYIPNLCRTSLPCIHKCIYMCKHTVYETTQTLTIPGVLFQYVLIRYCLLIPFFNETVLFVTFPFNLD